MKKITILITDDHTLVRESWALLLNTDKRFEVIAQCGSGEEAVEKARSLQPEIVLMDINLPGISGIEATQLVRKHSPGSVVLAVSLHSQPAYVRKMMKSGAMGYITKNSSKEEMCKAILELKRGKKYICEEVKSILSERVMDGKNPLVEIKALSVREIEVIEFLKEGFSSKEIAGSLTLSVKTVEVHRYNILKKLKLKNVTTLVNFMNQFAQA